jgi:hypothetical protein
MVKFLAPCLVLLASAASAAAPLETAAAIAAQLGAPVAVSPAAEIASPAAKPAPADPKAPSVAAPIKISSLAGSSGSISGNVSVSGNGPMNCLGGRMSAWINLRADVSVTTDDGATAQFPVTGTVYLSGSCQRGSGGFVNGNVQLNGSGSLVKAGRSVGTVSLSGNAFINQYVTGTFAWINQNVSLSGSYSESAAASK